MRAPSRGERERDAGHGPAAVVAVVTTAATMAGAAAFAGLGAEPSEVASTVALAFVPWSGLILWSPAGSRRRPWALPVLVAGLVGLLLVAAPPVLSDDVFRYLWDGRVLRHGIDPYRYAPSAPALVFLRDALFLRVSFHRIATIYPPLAELLFALGDAVVHAPQSLKLIALTAHLGTVPVVARLAGPRRASGAAWVFALHPLALESAALDGHVDAAAALALALAVLALARDRPLRAALLSGVASGLKLGGLILAPFLFGRSRRAAALSLLLGLAALAPLLFAGSPSGSMAGVGQYARRWQGNDGGFVVLEAATLRAVDRYARVTGAPAGHVGFPVLRPLLRAVRGTPFDPRAGLLGPKKEVPDPAELQTTFVAAMLARALAVSLIVLLALLLGRSGLEPVLAVRWVLLVALLLAPEVHPWYLVWLLPFEVASGRVAGLAWSALVLVAYAPLDAWIRQRLWVESPLAILFEYGVVVGALAVEVIYSRKLFQASNVPRGRSWTYTSR